MEHASIFTSNSPLGMNNEIMVKEEERSNSNQYEQTRGEMPNAMDVVLKPEPLNTDKQCDNITINVQSREKVITSMDVVPKTEPIDNYKNNDNEQNQGKSANHMDDHYVPKIEINSEAHSADMEENDIYFAHDIELDNAEQSGGKEGNDMYVKLKSKTELNDEDQDCVEPPAERRNDGQLEQTVKMTNMMYVENVPKDDHVLYCEDCKQEHKEHCPVHGPLIVIQNMKVEENDPDRALHSLPANLFVKESDIDEAGLGVFTDTEIQPGTTYGPYEGMYIADPDQANASGYSWQIYKDGVSSSFIDGKDTACSNWMRYVNCALSELDQNLVAFQYKGEIYFRCIQTILPKTELLVWYGDDCARKLGITRNKETLMETDSVHGEDTQIRPRARVNYNCKCCEKTCPNWTSQQEQKKSHNEKAPCMCSSCYYHCNCTSSLDIKRHLKIHSRGDKLYKCKACYEAFSQSSSPCDHMVSYIELPHTTGDNQKAFNHSSSQLKPHLKEGLYKCEDCAETFVKVCDLKRYKSVHTGEKQLEYDTCDKAYIHHSHLTSHERIHTGEKRYKCNFCDKSFSDKHNLSCHERIHTGEKPYECKFCDKAFIQKASLTAHERKHTGGKPYMCKACYKTFRDKYDLTRHERLHTGKKPYKCNFCDKAFSDKHNLTCHERIHTGKKPYKCNFCDKAFSEKRNLARHERIHTGKKPYKCNICKKAFNDKHNMTRHERIHTRKTPYKCNFCDKAFSEKRNLTRHERIHTGKKRYKCNICKKAFSDKHNLTRHERIHTGKTPYKCIICDKAFGDKHNLTRHERIHTGKKPYKCNICDKAFSDKSNLKCHERIHTKEKSYKCNYCDKAFIQKTSLTVHERKHTGEKPYMCKTV